MSFEQNISFIIPAYNCEKHLEEAVNSIFEGNFQQNDEVIICNDGSSDNTFELMVKLSKMFEGIKLLSHKINRGGGAARNTAACSASNTLIFCLDSDNILNKNSIPLLKAHLEKTNADMAAFANVHFFSESPQKIDKIITYAQTANPFQDYLSKIEVPGGDGNYLYKKSAWEKVGGYPEFAHAMDTWGFGFRMAGEGCKSVLLENEFYLHRFGHGSYWDRCKGLPISIITLQLLLPFVNMIEEHELVYIFKNYSSWYRNIENRPIKVKNCQGKQLKSNTTKINSFLKVLSNFKRKNRP